MGLLEGTDSDAPPDTVTVAVTVAVIRETLISARGVVPVQPVSRMSANKPRRTRHRVMTGSYGFSPVGEGERGFKFDARTCRRSEEVPTMSSLTDDSLRCEPEETSTGARSGGSAGQP